MGMHEFEDVVEASIVVLDKNTNSYSLDMRSIFGTLYRFQEMWDTGNTYFRIIDILIKHRFMYHMEVAEYPNYLNWKDIFEQFTDDFIESIVEYPDQEWHPENNPETGGYYWRGSIYFTAGSTLWQHMVDAGKLTGEDALPMQEINLLEVVKESVLAAEILGEEYLYVIEYWYALLAAYLYPWDEEPIKLRDRLQKNELIQEIREVILRTEAFINEHDYGMLRRPEEDDDSDMEDNEFLQWWFSLGKVF